MPQRITGCDPVRGYLVPPAGTSGDTRARTPVSLSADGKLSVQSALRTDASSLDAEFVLFYYTLLSRKCKAFFGSYCGGPFGSGSFLEKSNFHFPFTRTSLSYSHMRYPSARNTASRMSSHTATPP